MGKAKRKTVRRWAAGLILFGVAAASAFAGQAPPGPGDIRFLFAFGAQSGNEASRKPVAVQEEMALKSGDRLKLYLEPWSDIYVYLFHLSSQTELTLLYPFAGRPAKMASGAQVFVPQGLSWLQLDAHTGRETFVFIASAQKLDRLESLLERHAALKEKPALQASVDAILDEVRHLQQNKPLNAPAEKPVRIGGTRRGPQPPASPVVPDITPLATEITAPGFYSRTFTIDHQ
jgi:hypothetical protein